MSGRGLIEAREAAVVEPNVRVSELLSFEFDTRYSGRSGRKRYFGFRTSGFEKLSHGYQCALRCYHDCLYRQHS